MRRDASSVTSICHENSARSSQSASRLHLPENIKQNTSRFLTPEGYDKHPHTFCMKVPLPTGLGVDQQLVVTSSSSPTTTRIGSVRAIPTKYLNFFLNSNATWKIIIKTFSLAIQLNVGR